jgi:pyruvate formate lyase activating enzyme
MPNLFAAVDLAAELCIPHIHLLPYNASSGAKYEWVGRDYGLLLNESNPPDVEALIARSNGKVAITIVG